MGLVPREKLSLKEEALVRQWLEYKKVVLDKLDSGAPVPNSVLVEIDSKIADRSYLAGNCLTEADIQLHSGLHAHYSTLSHQSKEMHTHLSRWFSHVQHTCKMTPVSFSKSLLY